MMRVISELEVLVNWLLSVECRAEEEMCRVFDLYEAVKPAEGEESIFVKRLWNLNRGLYRLRESARDLAELCRLLQEEASSLGEGFPASSEGEEAESEGEGEEPTSFHGLN